MNTKTTLLTTKLMPPQSKQLLRRERLRNVMCAEDVRVSLVYGPAGYGKTTLLLDALNANQVSSVWLRLDPDDRDFALFLSYVLEGLGRIYDDFGVEIRERIRESRNIESDAEALLTLLINELADVESQGLTFFFDDFHTVAESPEIQKAVLFLLENAPPGVRLVIAGRDRPGFYLGRLRLQQTVVEIGRAELRFSEEEIALLFDEFFEIPLGEHQIKILHEKTEGWPAALVLIKASLAKLDERDALVTQLPDLRHLYEYLAAEVFDKESKEAQDILMKISPLSSVDPFIVGEVLALKNADGILRETLETNSSIFSYDGSAFRCHPLYRQFLLDRLTREFGVNAAEELHFQYAEAFEKRGDFRQAIPYFFASKKPREATRLVQAVGQEMIESGQIDTLERWLAAIPARLRTSVPSLCLLEGQVLKRRGRLAQALKKFELSRQIYNDDKRGVFKSLYEAGDTYKWMGNYGMAAKQLEAASENGPSLRDKLAAQMPLISCYFMIGERQKAKDLCLDTLADHHGVRDLLLPAQSKLAFMRMCAGCFLDALTVLKEASAACSSGASVESLIVWNNLARCYYLLAKYEQARTWAERAVETCKRYQQQFFEPTALDTLGLVLLAQGEEMAGLELLEEGLRLAERYGDEETIIIGLSHLGTYHRRAGNVKKALALHGKAKSKADAGGLPHLMSITVSNIGADLVATEPGQASDCLDEALDLAKRNEFQYVKMGCLYHKAGLALKFSAEEGDGLLREALELAAKQQYDHFLIQEGKVSLLLLLSAFEKGLQRDYVSTILERVGRGVVEGVVPYLDNADPELQRAAIELMGKTKDVAALNPLRKLLRKADPELKQHIRTSLELLPTAGPHPQKFLTPREMEVLELIGRGSTNKVIAATLFLSEATVKTHVNRIFHKLGLDDRIQAVLYYQKVTSGEDGQAQTTAH